MAVSMLRLHGQLHGLVEALTADDGEHRHQLLHGHERVIRRNLADDQPGIAVIPDSHGLQHQVGILADPVLIYVVISLRVSLKHRV